MLTLILGVVQYLRIHLIRVQAEGPLPRDSRAWQLCIDARSEDGELGDIYAQSVTLLKLTELAVDGEHIPRLPINEPEVPESHILQQEDNCPLHVVIECLLVGTVFILILEGKKKVNQLPNVEKEDDLDDDDCQQGLQGLMTSGRCETDLKLT